MIRQENHSYFHCLGINLMKNYSKVTIDQISYVENLKTNKSRPQ